MGSVFLIKHETGSACDILTASSKFHRQTKHSAVSFCIRLVEVALRKIAKESES